MSWKDRILIVKRIPSTGEVNLFGLGPFAAEGHTGTQLTQMLHVSYSKEFPERPLPPLNVEVRQREPTPEFLALAEFSLLSAKFGICPNYRHPAVLQDHDDEKWPRQLDSSDLPTFEDIERLVADLEP